ncbi:hypothetical protein IFM89_031352 [Coptis chinensis]|uniref:BPL/LPL catalytic domain-containing protein n=1 Tax=Coptis chinensis TaxID=261450 RepID=A0A835IW38_9MAGN|nr:hypothetical protein IFM89_031352 [Coptis chinensis]
MVLAGWASWSFDFNSLNLDALKYRTQLKKPKLPLLTLPNSYISTRGNRPMTIRNNITVPLMNLIKLGGTPILQQLHLEEKLLRTSSLNWCIVNDGTNVPTVVMGMSGVPAELLELEPVIRDKVPVIRRFTGGGTVIVDHETIFVTFICNKDDLPSVQPYPRPIMDWSGLVYKEVFNGIGDFHLRENDYVLGNRKFGGNAQSITKNRWVHHTSFLWNYDVRNMAYLKLPSRVPEYRSARNHVDFVCRMKEHISRSTFIERTVEAIGSYFSVEPIKLETIGTQNIVFTPSTRLLSKEELSAAFGSQIENSCSERVLS